MKKQVIQMPSFLEIFQAQRVQVKMPRGGSHGDKTKYNRKEKHKKGWE